MSAFLYIMHERDWRSQSFQTSEKMDYRVACEADMIIEFDNGVFRIHKNRFGSADGITLKVPIDESIPSST